MGRRTGMMKNERVGKIANTFEQRDGRLICQIEVHELCYDNNEEPYNAHYNLVVETKNEDFKDTLQNATKGQWVAFGFYAQSYSIKGSRKDRFVTKLKLKSLEILASVEDRIQYLTDVYESYNNVISKPLIY